MSTKPIPYSAGTWFALCLAMAAINTTAVLVLGWRGLFLSILVFAMGILVGRDFLQ
jgi:hypothetical protein